MYFDCFMSALAATRLLAIWHGAPEQFVHGLLIASLLLLTLSALMLLRTSRRHLAERHAADQRYASLFHSLHEAVFVSNPQGQLVDFNGAFANMLGYTRQELMAVNARDLYADPNQRNFFVQQMEREGFLQNAVWQVRRKDGSSIWVLENSNACCDKTGKVLHYQGFLLDVTDKKHSEEALQRRNAELTELYDEVRRAYDNLRQTQEQLLQSEKMSAIGQLIAGVAHELNNPLTAILGYTQLLGNEKLTGGAADYVEKLHKQTQRTQKIVQNLLSFARQRKPQRIAVDVGCVIDEMLSLRGYDLKVNNIEVERTFEPGVAPVLADAHQLEQVFLNIINNAADAMLADASRGTLHVRVFEQNGRVVAEFRDSGPGVVDPRRIFDPFFTTKPVGKGTGLGLSICYGIVKEHGGEISASNHDGGGAVFQVTLPAAPANKEIPQAITPTESKSPLSCRVLLIDDEEPVLDFEKEVLTKSGAKVTLATSGEKALTLLELGHFDVVVTDSKMPGRVSGPEVYDWIREYRPELARRVIFTLSNAAESNLTQMLSARGVPALVKPFDCSELIRLISDVSKRPTRAAAARV
jgi:two-component system, NtrC family, sensor kinase